MLRGPVPFAGARVGIVLAYQAEVFGRDRSVALGSRDRCTHRRQKLERRPETVPEELHSDRAADDLWIRHSSRIESRRFFQ